jgi:hypothetical protein
MLESVKDNVDTIIVADGAYELYLPEYQQFHPDAKPWSTDGSLQILRVMPELPPIKVIECPDGKPWKNQCVKRTALIDAVPNGDWFIIIDADLMLVGDVATGMYEIMSSGCIVGGTPYYNPGLDLHYLREHWHPWIYQKTEGMHYLGTHWYLRDRYGRVIENAYPVLWTDKFVFVHFKAFKKLDRTVPHQNYMELLEDKAWMEPQ